MVGAKQSTGVILEANVTHERRLGALVRRPTKVEMEFGATLSADCDLWVVSGKGEAEFKVTLSWDADSKPA